MPYTQCAHCAGLTYSAARWSSVEDCPQCGRRLPEVNALARRVVLGSLALPGAALAAVALESSSTRREVLLAQRRRAR